MCTHRQLSQLPSKVRKYKTYGRFFDVFSLFETSNIQFIKCPGPLIINSSQVVDVSDWNTDFVKVLAIGGGGGFDVMILKYFTIINIAAELVSASTEDVFLISY